VLKDFRGTLRAAKKGDEDAFARIWREFNPGLVRYLRVKATSEAEDLAADIWYRAIRALNSFQGDEDGFRAWLYASARNRAIDWHRGDRRRPQSIDHSMLLMMPAINNVETQMEENSATDAAIGLIAQLPSDQAEAVMLRTVAGLDVSAVAEIMGRSPGSVRVLCHRGHRRLAGMLSVEDSVPGEEGLEVIRLTSVAAAPPMATQSRLSGVHNG
jgi:RNA polymerase sigma-70 factor, ECF subfamily